MEEKKIQEHIDSVLFKTQEQIASIIFLDIIQKEPDISADKLRERLAERGVVLTVNGNKM